MRSFFWMGLLVLSGCWEQPSVYRYVAPKIETDTSHRLLGAITRSTTGTWFFKASGPTEKISPIEKDFKKLVESIRFQAESSEPILWTLPEDWLRLPDEKIPDSQFKPYAVLKAGLEADAPEVSVTRFGPRQGGDLNTNITRWRKQIGLTQNRTIEIESSYEKLKQPHGPVYLVDIAGPGPPETTGPMTAAARSPHDLVEPGSANAGEKLFKHLKEHLVYVKPDGWDRQETEGPGVLRHFVIRSRGRRAELLIQAVPLESQPALLNHLNRFTSRLNLPPITPQNLSPAIEPVTLGAGGPQSGSLVDWTPASSEKGLVVVVTNQAGFPVLFHLYGDAVLVRQTRPVFKAFCRSFWFHGEEHD
ncbi:MAG: hypothetical protein R3236_05510 [Phycisphaeraceae bacterium]|nr:hypothetical protein [Phycisphaeraceae bacterium]